jgi:FixJ family two-component response regulator
MIRGLASFRVETDSAIADNIRVAVIADELGTRNTLVLELNRAGINATPFPSLQALIFDADDADDFDCMIVKADLPNTNGLQFEATPLLQNSMASLVFVVASLGFYRNCKGWQKMCESLIE